MAIVDDHQLVRNGFLDMVKEWPHGTVVLEAANGLEYEERCREAGPIDIAIVDLHMPIRDGWETLRWIEQHQKPTKAIVLSFDQTPQNTWEVLQLGARGFLPKTIDPPCLHAALDQLVATGFHYSDLVRQVLKHPPMDGSAVAARAACLKKLSPTEQQVFRLLIGEDEPTNAQIGERLNMQPGTVGTHVKTIYRKLGVRSRVKAVYAAIRAGLIGKDGRWMK